MRIKMVRFMPVFWVCWLSFGNFCAAASYEDIILRDNPQWYLRLDDPAGSVSATVLGWGVSAGLTANYWQSVASDLIPTPVDNHTPLLGQIGIPGGGAGNYAAYFDGSSQIFVNNAPLLNDASCTMEMWIRPVSNSGMLLVHTDGAGPGRNFSSILEVADNKNRVDTYTYTAKPGNSNGQGVEIKDVTLPQLPAPLRDTWYYIATVLNQENGTMDLYINGSLRGSRPVTEDRGPWAGNEWRVGGSRSWYTGYMDEVAVYQTALTAQQVKEHYRAGMMSTAAVLPTLSLSLADIVSGGNGLARSSGGGIDPRNGLSLIDAEGLDGITHNTPAAVNLPFVNSVFVPQGNANNIPFTADLSVTMKRPGPHIGGSDTDSRVPGSYPGGYPGWSGDSWWEIRGFVDGVGYPPPKMGPNPSFALPGKEVVNYASEGHSLLVMHANKGITFDLQEMAAAMQTQYGADYTLDRFITTLANTAGGVDGRIVDVSIYIDGYYQWGASFNEQKYEINLGIPVDAKYLTIIAGDGGNGYSMDQIVLGDPRITLEKNVALGKPVYASNTYGQGGGGLYFSPSRITDGKLGNTFLGKGGGIEEGYEGYWLAEDGKKGEYFIVDLEGLFRIDRIDLQNTRNQKHNDSGTKEYTLEISEDGFNWIPVVEHGFLTSTHPDAKGFDAYAGDEYYAVPFDTVSFDAMWARYVRFTAEDYYGRAGLAEIRVYEYDAPTPEPATWVMMILGVGGLIVFRRKRGHFSRVF